MENVVELRPVIGERVVQMNKERYEVIPNGKVVDGVAEKALVSFNRVKRLREKRMIHVIQ